MILIRVMNSANAETAVEFIWNVGNSLGLKPDWHNPAGEKNKSFERWISGK